MEKEKDTETDDKKEILQDPNEELPPPLYWMMNPPSNVSARPGALTATRPRLRDIPASPLSPALPSAPPEVVEPPPQQAPTLVGGTTGYRPPDSAPATEAQPKLYPPPTLPPPNMSTDQKGKGNIGIKQRLCSAKELEEKTPFQMPLRKSSRPAYRGKMVIITRLLWPTTINYFCLLIY